MILLHTADSWILLKKKFIRKQKSTISDKTEECEMFKKPHDYKRNTTQLNCTG